MSKGARKRKDYAEFLDKLEQEQAEKKQKKKLKKIVISVICIVIALAAAATGCFFGVNSYLTNSGYYLRNDICLSSTDYQINNAQLSYYFQLSYNSFISTYSSSLTSMGLDSNKTLKSQKCSYYDGYDTWFDYFLKQAQNRIENTVSYALAAKSKGMSLSDEETAQIETTIKNMESTAQSSNQSLEEYVAKAYGTGVSVEDVRSCLELSALANQYYYDYDEAISYTDKQIEEFYQKSPEKYNVVDYKSYEIDADTVNAESSEEAAKMLDEAKAAAEKIGKATNEAEFNSLLKQYFDDYYKAKNTQKTSAELDKLVSNTASTGNAYQDGTELTKWAFDTSRKVGDVTVIEDSDNASYIVYCITKTQYRQTYLTKNVRHILVTSDTYGSVADALTAAQDILNAAYKEPNLEQAFIDSAKQYSEDSGSRSNGGLYENVEKGEMDTAFDEWCYYSGRKSGDTGVILTNYGYHAMYFVGNGRPAWQNSVIDAMKTEQYADLMDELQKTYSIEFHNDVASNLEK